MKPEEADVNYFELRPQPLRKSMKVFVRQNNSGLEFEEHHVTFIGAKNIPKPQLMFKDGIDNSDTLWVPKIFDKPNSLRPLTLNILYNDNGEAVGYEHPYKLELEDYVIPLELLDNDDDANMYPPPTSATQLIYITTKEQLDNLINELENVNELAVDLEHHSYRSYQGFTCLIQISTYYRDIIIDTLAVREHVHKLNQIFTDPKKIKVFHGADNDVLWLQRDFGVYVVGMFDTHQAARLIRDIKSYSLRSLIDRYCQVEIDKTYQLADWRIRPLPLDLTEYARSDTHYLLYIWRCLKCNLITESGGDMSLLQEAFKRSQQICAQTYNKPFLTDDSHIPLYLKSKKSFNQRQMAALRMLYRWRDIHARELDESTIYLLPNHMLLDLAEKLPGTVQETCTICTPMPPFVKQNIIEMHNMILSCHELPLVPVPEMLNAMEEVTSSPDEIEGINMELFPDYDDSGIDDDDSEIPLEPELPHYEPYLYQFLRPREGSRLNVDAKIFVPPYDRYRMYRSLTQDNVEHDYRRKYAVPQDNYKELVLIKLKKYKTEEEIEAEKKIKEEGVEAELDYAKPSTSTSIADECIGDTGQASGRKRKIVEAADNDISESKQGGDPSGLNWSEPQSSTLKSEDVCSKKFRED